MLSPIILPDTNYLIEHPAIDSEEWLLAPLEIHISETVLAELRGLGRNDYELLARKARISLKVLEQLQAKANSEGEYCLSDNVSFVFVPRFKNVNPPLDPETPDHQIIAYARSHFRAKSPRFCAILSADKELSDVAEALQVIAVWPGSKMHEELARKYHWWKTTLEPVDEPVQPKPLVSEPQAQFDRFIHHLYGQFVVNRYRTVMAIAPLRARLALTSYILKKVPNPNKQVVLVVVESAEGANYWAGEIRRQTGFSAAEVQIFGIDNLDRLEMARAILYRHDQVGRRLPRHLDRLSQAEQKLTAVVDGCDLLDPVSLAHLLFECDQFVGLTHYPLGYARRPADRMLDAFLRGKAELAYAFADAERDKWGHAFDPYLRPVSLTIDEQGMWDDLNAKYIRQRELVVKQHKELVNSEDFWQALIGILGKKAAPEAAKLLELWEERERIAQLARNKLQTVVQLVRSTANHHSRRLILDYERQWTPVLLKQFENEAGVTAVELPNDPEDQRPVWDRFAGNRYNTMLFSDAPAINLPQAFYSHLIILTPLRPMSEISRVIDWALTHTSAEDALWIDLIYVPETPEEVTMFDLAEACFDLRYTDRKGRANNS